MLRHIEESRQRWRPVCEVDAISDPRMVMVDVSGLQWSDPAVEGAPPKWAECFLPDFSPMQMMLMGIFGDAYWSGSGAGRAAMLPQNKPLTKSGLHYFDTRGSQCATVNFFGRPASMTKDVWLNQGMIFSPDPLGWFEWYCWYWLGRRIPGYDDHQLKRWVGYKERQTKMYLVNPFPGTAQALLHWGIRAPHVFD